MEQFSLEKWLQDKSRKIVTRDGKPVRIVCWDLKCNTPIIAAIQWNQEREDCYCYNTIGRCANNVCELDLFFADEEKRLTEFDKAMIQFSHERNSLIQFEHTTEEINAHLYLYSKKLLDLARKEILKDLPKWKKATEKKDLEKHIAILEENKVLLSNYLEEGDYYIDLEDLKALPKEE